MAKKWSFWDSFWTRVWLTSPSPNLDSRVRVSSLDALLVIAILVTVQVVKALLVRAKLVIALLVRALLVKD